jgi:hypothetical protein
MCSPLPACSAPLTVDGLISSVTCVTRCLNGVYMYAQTLQNAYERDLLPARYILVSTEQPTWLPAHGVKAW